jgi:flagellar biosynthesis protein FlhB
LGIKGQWRNKPTEEAGPKNQQKKKVLDEFEKGNIPVSREASAFAAILPLLAITAFMARDFLKSVGFTPKRLSSDPGGLQLQNGADMASLFEILVWEIGASIVPVLAVLLWRGLLPRFFSTLPASYSTGSSRIGIVYH